MKYSGKLVCYMGIIFSLSACGGSGGSTSASSNSTSSGNNGATDTPTTPVIVPAKDDIPTISLTAPTQYKTTVEQRLDLVNNKNEGTTLALTPSSVLTVAATDPAYSIQRQKDTLINFNYNIGPDESLDITYDVISKKINYVRFKKGETDLSCRDTQLEGCANVTLAYDEVTGNSTVSFNNQSFEASFYRNTDTAPFYEKVPYKISLNGTVKGTIDKKPFAFSDFEQKFTGRILVDNQPAPISRAYMRDDQLVIQLKNGETLYVATGSSFNSTSSFYSDQGVFTGYGFGNLSKLDNDRVNVKISNMLFTSTKITGSKRVDGDITLIHSLASFNIPEIDSNLNTSIAYIDYISNQEKNYFISFSSSNAINRAISANLTTKDENLLSMSVTVNNITQDPVIYSCKLSECKNPAISKDGTYIIFSSTTLKSSNSAIITINGKIRTNLR